MLNSKTHIIPFLYFAKTSVRSDKYIEWINVIDSFWNFVRDAEQGSLLIHNDFFLNKPGFCLRYVQAYLLDGCPIKNLFQFLWV